MTQTGSPQSFIVRWFSELGAGDTATAGGKGANLGELTRAGLPVPDGFVITAQAFLQAIEHAGLRESLCRAAARAPDEDSSALSEGSTSLAGQIRDVECPPDIVAAGLSAYRRLGAPAVAVRSSATAEDTDSSSFAGMNETFTNVHSEAELLTCVKDCWASAYGTRVMSYRASQQITAEPAIAVVVQRMV